MGQRKGCPALTHSIPEMATGLAGAPFPARSSREKWASRTVPRDYSTES